MSESVSQTMRRALGATAESRALVTAVLPAVSYGMRHSADVHPHLAEALDVLSTPECQDAKSRAIVSLGSLGVELRTDTDFALLMSAVQTAVFVVRYASVVEADPEQVWQRYIGQMVGTESDLEY